MIIEGQQFSNKNRVLDTSLWPFRPKHIVDNLLNSFKRFEPAALHETVSAQKNGASDVKQFAEI
jgi:hypothetical protein